MMYSHRRLRFSPKVQATILVGIILVQAWSCWLLVDAVRFPDKVPAWKAWAGALAFSLAAEAWGVLIALALSRSNDV